jgi:hypothetical protein
MTSASSKGDACDVAEAKRIRAVNVGPLLLAKVHDSDICEYFCTNHAAKSGHYTVKGNRVLAEVTWEIIERLGLVSATR